MVFVKRNTATVPVPQIFAYYTYGPLDRDEDDYGSLYDTYIFMDFVEGRSLDGVWGGLDQAMKGRVADQLGVFLEELREIGCGGGGGDSYIGSVDSGPVTDPMLEYYPDRGAWSLKLIQANA